eukprot:4559163-Prymnesium_polylepis.1
MPGFEPGRPLRLRSMETVSHEHGGGDGEGGGKGGEGGNSGGASYKQLMVTSSNAMLPVSSLLRSLP